MNTGKTDEAEKVFDAMLKRRPKYYAKVQYVYFLMQSAKVEKASQVYDKYVKLAKGKRKTQDEILANMCKSLILWKNGDLKAAIGVTENAYNKYKNTTIYINLGFFYMLNGEYEKALKINLEGVEFSPENLGILDNLGYNYILLNEYEKAEEVYNKIFEINNTPSFAEAYFNFGLIKEQEGKNNEAKALYEKALTSKFSNIGLLTENDVKDRIKSLS